MPMNAHDYKEMAVKIKAELESLEVQQEEIERRIARLKQSLIGLVPLSEPHPDSPIADEIRAFREEIADITLTDAVRQIFQAAKNPLSPTDAKQQLLNMGRDLSGQKNVMASIHSLLKRLVESQEIETKDGGLTYQWKTRAMGRLSEMNAIPIPRKIKITRKTYR